LIPKQENSELANEEIQRAIEFLVQQQAQYTARLEKDEVRLAELGEYFKMLVDLARGADERLDSHDSRFESDEVRRAELEESFKMLVELCRRTDGRQDTLGETMAALSHTMNELARRADEQQDTLGESMAALSHTMNELARRADEQQDTLGETMAALSHTMNELARRADERQDQDTVRFERDESRLVSLEESFRTLVELAHRHE